jgi:hypothetical protein
LEPQRSVLWSIFERVHASLQSRQLITYAELFTSLAAAISQRTPAGGRIAPCLPTKTDKLPSGRPN